jgi:hypothetical protein
MNQTGVICQYAMKRARRLALDSLSVCGLTVSSSLYLCGVRAAFFFDDKR